MQCGGGGAPGRRRGVRFHPGRPTIEEVAKRGAPPAAVGAVALLEDSSESSGRASEPIRARRLQFSAPSETVMVDAFGMGAFRLESPSGAQMPGGLKSGYSGIGVEGSGAVGSARDSSFVDAWARVNFILKLPTGVHELGYRSQFVNWVLFWYSVSQTG